MTTIYFLYTFIRINIWMPLVHIHWKTASDYRHFQMSGFVSEGCSLGVCVGCVHGWIPLHTGKLKTWVLLYWPILKMNLIKKEVNMLDEGGQCYDLQMEKMLCSKSGAMHQPARSICYVVVVKLLWRHCGIHTHTHTLTPLFGCVCVGHWVT